MELIVQVLLVLATLSALFQMSQWGLVARLVVAVTLALIAYSTYPWIIEQSRQQLNNWMNDAVKMQNLAVVQVIEALLFILIDLALLKRYFGQPVKKSLLFASYFPGVLLIAVMLYVQMLCFYSISSIDFDTLGAYFAVGLAIVIFLAPLSVRWVIPEHYLRMELRYILNFGQILGGIVITVFCQGLAYPRQQTSFEWTSLAVLIAITATTIIAGWIGTRIVKRIKFQWKY